MRMREAMVLVAAAAGCAGAQSLRFAEKSTEAMVVGAGVAVKGVGAAVKGVRVVWKELAVATGGITVESTGAADIPDLMIAIGREAIPEGRPVDLVYVIDTTGSMRDDIDEAKDRMHEILADLSRRNPDRRVGIVAYRDRGDDYVARVMLPLAADAAAIQAGIDALAVGGGGDDPEHVYAGIDTALREQPWRAGVERHLVLMGDAPPHDDYADDPRTYASTVELARATGVRISTIGVYTGGLPRKPVEAIAEHALDPALRARASANGKYAGLTHRFRAGEDREDYGELHDYGYWPGGTYKGMPDMPAGYWVYVAPYWYIWSRPAP